MINQVANGWIVTLPVIEKPFNEMQHIKQVASVFSKVQNKDEKLAEIEAQTELEQEKAPTLADLKQDNVHVFKTFPEVLSFLKYQIDTEEYKIGTEIK